MRGCLENVHVARPTVPAENTRWLSEWRLCGRRTLSALENEWTGECGQCFYERARQSSRRPHRPAGRLCSQERTFFVP